MNELSTVGPIPAMLGTCCSTYNRPRAAPFSCLLPTPVKTVMVTALAIRYESIWNIYSTHGDRKVNLVYHIELETEKNNKKLKNKNRYSSEEMVTCDRPWRQCWSRKGVCGGKDLWNRQVLNRKWYNEEVMDCESGELTEEEIATSIKTNNYKAVRSAGESGIMLTR